MFDWLNGKKTYVVGIGAILAIVATWFSGGDYNWTTMVDMLKEVLTPLLAILLRHGVSKAEKNG